MMKLTEGANVTSSGPGAIIKIDSKKLSKLDKYRYYCEYGIKKVHGQCIPGTFFVRACLRLGFGTEANMICKLFVTLRIVFFQAG